MYLLVSKFRFFRVLVTIEPGHSFVTTNCLIRSKFTWANDKKLASVAEVFIFYVDASAKNAAAETLKEQICEFENLHKGEEKIIALTSD